MDNNQEILDNTDTAELATAGSSKPVQGSPGGVQLDVVAPMSTAALVRLANESGDRIEAFNKIRKAAISMTTHRGWTSIDGNPWMGIHIP